MEGLRKQFILPVLAVLALILIGAAFFQFGEGTSVVKAQPEAAPLAQKPNNSDCLGCHSRPDQLHKFPNGDTVSISVDPEVYDTGVHSSLDCQVCHTNIDGFPHPENPAKSAREYTLLYADTCRQCHPNQVAETADSAHAELAREGNPNTPICASCHNPHTERDIVTDENGDPVAAERPHIAEVCSACHNAIVEEYRDSVHGTALFEDSNPDVPACNDCHGIHKISQARTVEFRLNSPELCATCHTRQDIMGKYGLSTDVLDTYLSDFHGTTVMMYDPNDKRSTFNAPVCYDCHGVHNIADTQDPVRGLQIKQNMLATCQKCHPDASENFPASWMSHYIASPTRFPLVYYVNLFYMFFIPAVLGGMGLFVLSDILHRAGITRRKPKTAVPVEKNTKE